MLLSRRVGVVSWSVSRQPMSFLCGREALDPVRDCLRSTELGSSSRARVSCWLSSVTSCRQHLTVPAAIPARQNRAATAPSREQHHWRRPGGRHLARHRKRSLMRCCPSAQVPRRRSAAGQQGTAMRACAADPSSVGRGFSATAQLCCPGGRRFSSARSRLHRTEHLLLGLLRIHGSGGGSRDASGLDAARPGESAQESRGSGLGLMESGSEGSGTDSGPPVSRRKGG